MPERCDCCGMLVVYKDDGVCPSCQSSPAERSAAVKSGSPPRPKRRSPKKLQTIDAILIVIGIALANFAIYYVFNLIDPPRRRVTLEELERLSAERELRYREKLKVESQEP